MRTVALLLVVSIAACADSHSAEERLAKDPSIGLSAVMTVTKVREWELTQFRDDPGKFAMLGQRGRPIVSVLGGESGRSIYVEGERVGSDQLTIEIAEDNSVSEVSFFSDGVLYKLREADGGWILDRHRRDEP